MADTLTTATIAVGKASLTGVTVHAFTPIMFILLIVVIAVGFVMWKYGGVWFATKRKTQCPSCIAIVTSLNDTFRSRINMIKDSILKDQMNYAELVFGSIESKIVSAYKKNLDLLNISPLKKKEELTIYRVFLDNESFKLKDFVRLRLKSNHLTQYTKDQFKTYVSEITSKLIIETRLDMSNMWCKLFSVDVEDNKKEIDDLLPFISHDVESIFLFAYDTAIAKEKEIKDTEAEFDSKLNQVVKNSSNGKT